MGLLSKIVSGAEVAAGVAMEFVPGMQLAGAALITTGIASSGLIGGSVGKFLNSDWGKLAIQAVGLGATAYAAFGQTAADSSAAAISQTAQQGADVATGGETAAVGASGASSDVLPTQSAITTAADGQVVPPTPGSAAIGQTTTQAIQQSAPVSATGAPEANAQQVASTEAAVGETPPGGAPPVNTNPAGAAQQATGGANPSDLTGVDRYAAGIHEAVPSTTGSTWGDLLKNPQVMAGVAQGGFGLLSGVGKGMMESKAIRDQTAASQAAMNSWGNPTFTAGVENAVSQPSTVPMGYLQRAQALRAMLGSASTGGLAPTPGTPPPTMGPTMNGGSVPVLGMNATPRGGVI